MKADVAMFLHRSLENCDVETKQKIISKLYLKENEPMCKKYKKNIVIFLI